MRARLGNQLRGFSNVCQHSKFLTPLSARREPSPIRALQPLMKVPGMISLGTGAPNPGLFPITGLSFNTNDGKTHTLTDKELQDTLQYSATPGIPALLEQLRGIQQREHKPLYDDWSISVSTGGQDSLWKVMEMLIEPGDCVLVDNPCYSGALAWLHPYGADLQGVETDDNGPTPESLEKCILNARTKPKVFYTIPTGGNPSGCTTGDARKRAIYELCCKHDIIILEDDPYWFLHFGAAPAPAEEADFCRPPLSSYMSMDAEQRVIRFDSMSKVLSSGLRLGFTTGPKPLMEQLDLHSQATNLHTSGASQMLVLKLLQAWGEEGWNAHVKKVAAFYHRRRDVFMTAASTHLTGKATWTTPTSGMFVWFALNGVTDSQALIQDKAMEAKVILVPGTAFMPDKTQPSGHVRAAYSSATDEEIDQALSRLASFL